MNRIFLILALLFSTPAWADVVIVLKPQVRALPESLAVLLQGRRYTVKEAWKDDRLVLQNLPRTTWEKALRQPSMAVLLEGAWELESALPEGVERIEENANLEELEVWDRYKFDPVKCSGVIYGFGHYSTATQTITSEAPCDNFALRTQGGWKYRISVESASPKSVEVYEHGDLITTGEKQLEVVFNYGYRQKYLIVKGAPGPYRISVHPVAADLKKLKLLNLALSDVHSNAYGFGIPSLAGFGSGQDDAKKPSWTGAAMMSAERFWQKGFTGKGIKVAIVDTGIDSRHPFLKTSVVGGYEVFGKTTTPEGYQDTQGHGTHVAGIVHQVAPDAELLAVRVFPNDEGSGDSASLEGVAAGIRWAIDNGAQVINLSLGGDKAPASFKKVFEYGVSKGVLFAIASGNERSFDPLYPAAYAGEIPALGFSVGATDKYGNMAVFSNYTGNNLNMKHVASHGASVSSAAVGEQGFVSMSGTSMATPQIAGLLALYKQAYPNLSALQLQELVAKNVVRASVDD